MAELEERLAGQFEARLADQERQRAVERQELEGQLVAQRVELEGQLVAQRVELEERLAAQQDEIARLRAERVHRTSAAPAPPLILPARIGRRRAAAGDAGPDGVNRWSTSRRALLRLGGVGAAAGVVAAAGGLARGAPAAHAEPLPGGAGDGTAVIQGAANVNTSSTGTILNAVAASSPAALFTSDNSASANTNDTITCGVLGMGPTNANGVIGNCTGPGAFGVWGQSDSGIGVVGSSGTGKDFLALGTGRFQQLLQGSVWPPASGSYEVGEQIRDANGDLWICVKSGQPGHWVKVAAPQYSYAGGALNLLAVAIRLLDTRGGSPVAYHATVQFQAAGVGAIPTGATAVFGHLIAALRPGVNPGDGSSAILWPAGQTRPAAVNIVYNPGDLQGEYTGTLALVAIGAGGQISLYSQPILPGVAVDYLFDASGFVM